MSRLAVISLAFLLVAVARQGAQADDCFRLTAAFNYNGNIYLIDGVKYVLVNDQGAETAHGILAEVFNGPQGVVDAAGVSTRDGLLYFFQGNTVSVYSSSSSSTQGPNDLSAWDNFFHGGIDAIAIHGGKNYASRGCYYIADGMAGPAKLEKIGFPCNLDAAWDLNGNIYVTKGDNAWVMDPAKHVTGPLKLSDLLHLTSTSIC